MPGRSRALTFLRRRGHDVRVRGADGTAHDATLLKLGAAAKDEPAVREEGSFAFAYCKGCDWTGPARRSRGKAVDDARLHDDTCTHRPRVRVGVVDDGAGARSGHRGSHR